MTDRQTKWIGGVINGIFLADTVAAIALGERMNEHQLLGCLIVWLWLSAWALLAFWHGARPFFTHRQDVRWLALPCGIARIGLVFAIIQIPIWSLMTHQFPPDHFSHAQAYVATGGVVFGIVAPMAPMLSALTVRLWTIKKGKGNTSTERNTRARNRPNRAIG